MNCYWCTQPIEGLEYIQHLINEKYEKFHYKCYGDKLQGAEKP